MMNNNIRKSLFIFAFGILVSLGLIMNPGYFSHDEIGWGIKATSKMSLFDIDYYNIFNYKEFHYRPLNFNVWLFSSYYLFDTPQLYHLALLSFGLINSILVFYILKDEADERVAYLTAIISTAMPTILFVNGWIGTIADVFWFMCCAVSLLIYKKNRMSSSFTKLTLATLFFIFALMFKETAVVFPGVIFLYVLYVGYNSNSLDKFYKVKSDMVFFFVVTFITAVYLLLRFEFLFPSEGGGYGTSISNIPYRALDYFIYPFLINNVEIHGLYEQHTDAALALAFILHCFLIILVCRKNLFYYFLYFSCYFVTSVPILILDVSLPHYIYASGFVLAFSISYIFYKGNVARISSIFLFVLLALHGLKVQSNHTITGVYHNNFISTLYSVLKSNDDNCAYLVQAEPDSASWIAVRAIAFRKGIDDLNISERVFFDDNLLELKDGDKKCILLLDKKGRVKLEKDTKHDN